MSALPVVFPLLVVVGTLAFIGLAFRLGRRISRGSRSAGPFEPLRPPPPGLQQTPWELSAIADQLGSANASRSRIDLINTVNRLTRAAGETDPRFTLHAAADNGQIAWVIDHLERRLDLPAWTDFHQAPSPDRPAPQPLGFQGR